MQNANYRIKVMSIWCSLYSFLKLFSMLEIFIKMLRKRIITIWVVLEILLSLSNTNFKCRKKQFTKLYNSVRVWVCPADIMEWCAKNFWSGQRERERGSNFFHICTFWLCYNERALFVYFQNSIHFCNKNVLYLIFLKRD